MQSWWDAVDLGGVSTGGNLSPINEQYLEEKSNVERNSREARRLAAKAGW